MSRCFSHAGDTCTVLRFLCPSCLPVLFFALLAFLLFIKALLPAVGPRPLFTRWYLSPPHDRIQPAYMGPAGKLVNIRQADGSIEEYAGHFWEVACRSAKENICLLVFFWGGLAEPFKSRMPYWVPEELLADSGPWAHAVCSGPWAHAVSSVPWTHAVRSVPGAHRIRSAVCSGPWAHAVRSVPGAHAVCSGPGAHRISSAVQSGRGAHAVRSGPWAHAVRTGPGAQAIRSGPWAHRARSRGTQWTEPTPEPAQWTEPAPEPAQWPPALPVPPWPPALPAPPWHPWLPLCPGPLPLRFFNKLWL